MQSMTSGSRSSPPPSRASRSEQKHVNGNRKRNILVTVPNNLRISVFFFSFLSGLFDLRRLGETQALASPSVEETSVSQVALIHLPPCPEHHPQVHETEVEVYVDEAIARTTEKLSIVSELSELPDVLSPDEDYDLEQVQNNQSIYLILTLKKSP